MNGNSRKTEQSQGCHVTYTRGPRYSPGKSSDTEQPRSTQCVGDGGLLHPASFWPSQKHFHSRLEEHRNPAFFLTVKLWAVYRASVRIFLFSFQFVFIWLFCFIFSMRNNAFLLCICSSAHLWHQLLIKLLIDYNSFTFDSVFCILYDFPLNHWPWKEHYRIHCAGTGILFSYSLFF